MDNDDYVPVMDTQIFSLGLSIEATSAYILICSIAEEGQKADWPGLRAAWVGAPEALEPSLTELLAWRVIGALTDPLGDERFWPNPASMWRVPGTPLK
ncbi:MAG: hypothetical protein LBT38_00765 [Deltaproteobacteria bacterium]|jgi:hypothetical protein|nr:hypothetical protein [Deltaproteobacteria bacterium]